MSTKQLPGFFWYMMVSETYHVCVLDKDRKERDPRDRRRFTSWAREYKAYDILTLRRKARVDGVVLPRNVKSLCLASSHNDW